MTGTMWSKFFWSDWMSDPGVRACSYAARGLWMDLLCIAAEQKGFVTINGRKLDDATIARMTGGSKDDVATILMELETNNVFSKDRRGFIYCRRMVKSEINRRNGRLGGNPNLLKNKKTPDPLNHPPKPPIPRAISQKRETTSLSRQMPADWNVSNAGFSYAQARGWDDVKIASEGERFKDYCRSHGKKYTNFEAAWRNWVTSPYQTKAQTSSNGAPRPGSREDRAERSHHALEKLRTYANRNADEPPAGDRAGEPPPGLLPFPRNSRS